MKQQLRVSVPSFLSVFLVGLAVGCVCRLADYFPADTLWSFSSIQTLLGFWIITNTVIVLLSSSNLCAGVSSFLYMFGMTLSFYGLKAILGLFLPRFHGPFQTSLFLMFTILSVPCAIAAAILYFWNRDHLFNSVLYALPVGALLAEAVAIVLYLIAHQKFLFQLLMDIGGFLVFGGLFWGKVKSKPLYLLSVLLFAGIFYFAACQ